MDNPFVSEAFEHGDIKFTVYARPVSTQNRNRDKLLRLRREIQAITSSSEFIITGTCWIAIDYYCFNVNRLKYPGVYDIDNIIKPILDSLVGQDGLIIDDVLVDRVTVNWIDTPHQDHFEVQIEYPDLLYSEKEGLIFVKSASGWCFPTTQDFFEDPSGTKLLQHYFSLWNSINTEEDYYSVLPNLPIQNFIYYSKIKDRGYTFVDLGD